MLVTNCNEFEEIIKEAEQAEEVCYDLETNGLRWDLGCRLVGVALLVPHNDKLSTYYVPFRHTDPEAPFERWKLEHSEENLPLEELRKLNRVFADSDRATIGHNIGFDTHFTRIEGVKTPETPIDTQIGAHLYNENDSMKLENLAQKYIIGNSEFKKFANLLPQKADGPEEKMCKLVYERMKERWGERPKKSEWKRYMAVLDPAEVAPYAENDVLLTYLLRSFVEEELEKRGQLELWYEYCEYLKPCVAMEEYGLLIDVEQAEKNLKVARKKAKELKERSREITGIDDFNPNSPKQVCEYLDLDSSRKAVLGRLGHELAGVVLEYRQWARARDTYFLPYLEHLDHNSRVHTSLNITGTISGRLSSSSPNLQALPKKEDNYRVRDVVVAPPGFKLVSADYSQAELRLLAHYTKADVLMDVYQNSKDLHDETAARIGVPREIAKRINYGIIYGLTAHGLQKNEDLTISKKQAKQYLEQYHQRIPEIRAIRRQAEKLAKRRGYIEFWTGRRRHYEQRWQTDKALSNLIQGGVAEILRVAITRLHHLLRQTNVRMILQVHDELLFEVPEEELDYWLPRIKETMEDFKFNVPIVADLSVGDSWASESLEGWEPNEVETSVEKANSGV